MRDALEGRTLEKARFLSNSLVRANPRHGHVPVSRKTRLHSVRIGRDHLASLECGKTSQGDDIGARLEEMDTAIAEGHVGAAGM